MNTRAIPKSLHTVTVLVKLAQHDKSVWPHHSNKTAVANAAHFLGYEITSSDVSKRPLGSSPVNATPAVDPHDLIAAALRQLEKDTQS